MTVRATRFTPEVLLSAPRRGGAAPNGQGTRVLYTVSTYDFEEHKSHNEFKVLDVADNETRRLSKIAGVSDIHWLGDGAEEQKDEEEALFLVPGEKKGWTTVKIGNVGKEKDGNSSIESFEKSCYIAGEINASASNVRVKRLSGGNYAFVCSAPTTPDGELYNPEEAPEIHTTGRLYDEMFVRHWDSWQTANKSSLWYGVLEKKDEKWKLSSLTNALKGSPLECPIEPFGGTDHFDISEESGIVFVSKDPDVNEAFNTKANVYLLPLSWTESLNSKPQQVKLPGFDGASTSPVFSPDGKSVAFLSMHKNGYESDRNVICILKGLTRDASNDCSFASTSLDKRWDRSPSSIFWSDKGDTLYAIAEDEGQSCLFNIIHADNPGEIELPPTLLMRQGNISSGQMLPTGEIFVTGTSLVDNSAYYIVKPGPVPSIRPISSNSRNGSVFGLSPDQVSSWTYRSTIRDIQAWVIKPSNFNSNEKYPLAYLIHGGPQGAWLNAWSTRWNPAVFAEQGYVVVCPNPTGSTGFGQALTDAITNNWGGAPYDDLVAGIDAIEADMPFVDPSRMVALGASYGGYMINWIQGQPLGRRFKALVCHDGVFAMPAGQLATDEMYFPEHDFNGRWDANPEDWLRWNPAAYVKNWSTPQLVIHSAKDYRLCISEGLAAFGALQSRGVKSQFLTFPDENHWVLKHENSLLWHTAVLDWINEAVGLNKYSENEKAREVVRHAREGTGRVAKK